MSKTRGIIGCCVFVLLAVCIMGMLASFYVTNISYAYVPDEAAFYNSIVINNIDVTHAVDSYRVDGPNIIDNDISLNIDFKPNEVYEFKYDIVNKTGIDYLLSTMEIGCLNDPKVNDYLTIDMTFEDGSEVTNASKISNGAKRTVTVKIAYNKNVNGLKSFDLKVNMGFDFAR